MNTKIVEEIINFLEEQLLHVISLTRISQTFNLKQQGLVSVNGILIPQAAIDHRLLVDNYEVVFLKAIIELFKTMYAKRDDVFTEFTLRTFIEMTIDRARIVFDREMIETSKRKQFILCLMLDDYASMIGGNKYANDFQKLYTEEEALLDKSLTIILEKILNASSEEVKEKHIINLRREMKNMQSDYLNLIPLPIDFKQTKIKRLYKILSHMLHGNIFLLTNLIKEEEAKERRTFHLYASFLIGGGTLVNLVEKYLNYSQENVVDLQKFNSKLETEYKKLSMYITKSANV